MFGSSNNNNAKTNSALPKVAVDNFEAYIGKSTQITGNITAQGSIRIDGSSVITGDVRCEKLTVETGAVLRGNVGGLEDAAAPQLESAETK